MTGLHIRKYLAETIMLAAGVILTAGLLPGLLPSLGLADRNEEITLGASGDAMVMDPADDPGGEDYLLSTALIRVSASDKGISGEEPDRVWLDALINTGANEYHVTAREAIPQDPLGRFDTGGGVSRDVETKALADGSSWFPAARADVAIFGYAQVTCHGRSLGRAVPVRLTALSEVTPGEGTLILDIGDGELGLLSGGQPGSGSGRLRVIWPSYGADMEPLPEAGDICP